MGRERKFSIWNALSEKDAESSGGSGFIRKRAKTLTKTFLSPWAGKWNTNPQEIGMINTPRRRTFENLHVFLRNNKVISTAIHNAQELRDRTDTIIVLLAIGTCILGVFVVLILVFG